MMTIKKVVQKLGAYEEVCLGRWWWWWKERRGEKFFDRINTNNEK